MTRYLKEETPQMVRGIASLPYEPAVTEDAVALLFVELYGAEYRYVSEWDWMHYTGTHWTRDLARKHRYDVRNLCRLAGSDPHCQKQDARRLAMANTIDGVVKLASVDQRIVVPAAAFDADPHLLNTPAGIVDLRDGKVRPHAGDYLTKITAVAPMFGVQPKVWLRFLRGIFEGDRKTIRFLRRLLGYALTGDIREQVIVFFHGDGANGKSTLLDLLLHLFGAYAVKVSSSLLMAQRGVKHPTDVAQLRGVRLAVANEVAEGALWDESRVKELTGDAKLTARFMRQDYFQFDATHKFVIAANNRRQMRSMDHAMRRRVVLVPFHARFEGARRDPQMLEKLKAESGAILAWAIAGAAEWYRRGLEGPDDVRAASAEYANAMDSIGMWLEECCEGVGDPTASETSAYLYRSYAEWKRRRGEHPVSQMRWSEQVQGRGLVRHKSGAIRYREARLTPEERARVEAATAGRS